MKRSLLWGLALSLSSNLFADDPVLYKLNGKSYTSHDFSPALKQSAYDIQHQAYENLQRVIDAQIMTEYVEQEAKKKGVSVEKYEEETFKGKEVSEKQAKAWYEENKARLGGRDFDSIKTDVLHYLQNQENEKVRAEKIKKIKESGKFQLTLTEPEAPVQNISVKGFPTKGNEKGKVTIVEFADYKCPHCRDASKALKSLYEKYKSKVQFVYMDFPLDRSGVSKKVAEGAVCADQQKKFWDYHYMAFGDSNLNNNSPVEFAKKLKLNMKDFEACLSSPETTKKVDLSRSEGERIGVDGTPAIYFNGRKVYGHNEQMLEDVLKKML